MKIRLFNSENKEELSQIENIFFEASDVTTFESDQARESFREKYLYYYLKNGTCYVACIEEEILGYICGLQDISEHKDLFTTLPYLNEFNSIYENFPSVLHINMAAKSRGLGIGGQLLVSLNIHFVALRSKGVHLITSPDAKNVKFYKKYGFTELLKVKYGDSELLALGVEFDDFAGIT